MTDFRLSSCSSEAIVIIKAAPQIGQRHGETVCCAGIDLYGNWLRLYPVSFRTLEEGQKFGRWDRIRFTWRVPHDDRRIESRRVDQQSIQIVGSLKQAEHEKFLAKSIVTGLVREREAGKSLALLRPEILEFKIEKKDDDEVAEESRRFKAIRAQTDLFAKQVTPYKPCPYRFKYRYLIVEGIREGTCQDWELEATFFNRSKQYGVTKTLDEIQRIFGEEYPRRGMLLAMGTHSRYPDTWLINGVVRLDTNRQMTLF